jgi:hypothetical protein
MEADPSIPQLVTLAHSPCDNLLSYESAWHARLQQNEVFRQAMKEIIHKTRPTNLTRIPLLRKTNTPNIMKLLCLLFPS